MDLLSKILMSIDAVKAQFSGFNKRHADDYYEVVSPVDDHVLKMRDGSMITAFEMRGFGRMLSEREKRAICRKVERNMTGYLPNIGYTIQMVDLSDPDITRDMVEKSMAPSIEELKNMGVYHPIFGEDYIDFIAERSVWKKQYMVVYTHPTVLKTYGKDKRELSQSEKDALTEKEALLTKLAKQNTREQAVFLTDDEKIILSSHREFYQQLHNELSSQGALLSAIDVSDSLILQKRTLYGKACPKEWKPTLTHLGVVKAAETGEKAGQVSAPTPNVVEQIISQGGTEENLPIDVLAFGDRLFTTISMTLPQQDENNLRSYQHILSRIPRGIPYMFSMRLTTDPFSTSGYRTEQAYAGISGILPMSDNLLIRRARTALRHAHDNNQKTAVFMQLSVTLFSPDLSTLRENRNRVNNILHGWGNAQFRSVEQDKTQGLFDTLPGASKENNLKQVMENFADALYQSPMFMSGILYESGYLHFFTEDGQPFPFEEHSSLNINFNMFICGTAGAGKSTLLTLLNMALLAKPKTNPKLKGEFPLIMDVDFGKTSFGYKEAMMMLSDKSKRHHFLLKSLSTEADCAINPHDLPMGRRTPTVRQKGLLINFLTVLVGGVSGNKDDGWRVEFPQLTRMVKYLVDVVYDYRAKEGSARKFEPIEFKHPKTMAYLKRLGIQVSKNHSYYHIADEVMKKDPQAGAYHAIVLRRYAVPRLRDYSEVLTNMPEIASRYNTGSINGKTELAFFQERMADVLNEYKCFSRATNVPVDLARMISLDMKTVSEKSDYRKAVYGLLCMTVFLVKRENLEESEDLLNGVPEQHVPYLKRMDQINRNLPGSLNIEEAHVLYALFSSDLEDYERQNRKAGWGLRTLSQNLTDPTDGIFSLCSSVFVTSEEASKEAGERLGSINASEQEKQVVRDELNNRRFFLYVKTRQSSRGVKVKRVATKLVGNYSPGLLWVSNSDQTDRGFKRSLVERLGPDIGLYRLVSFFRNGSIRDYLDDTKMKDIAAENGYDSVFTMMIEEASKQERPPEYLAPYM